MCIRDRVIQLLGYDRRVGPLGHDPLRPVPDLIGLVAGPVPPDDSGIGRILEDIFQGPFFKGLSLAGFKAEACLLYTSRCV